MPHAEAPGVPGGVPLVVATRGAHVETAHRGSVAVVSANGRLLATAGDPRQRIWLRSAAKPFQVIPFLAAGGAARFRLSTRALALAAASHSGEPRHVRLAAAMLARGGFTEHDLHCGAHPPMHEATAISLRCSGQEPGPLHNNCSGKHAAMLLACRLLGLDARTYWRRDHPLQRRILATVARTTGTPPRDVGLAVDGCSVPVFRVPLAGLALGYARLFARAVPGESAREAAARRSVAAAMTAAPEMVAGTGRFTTALMRAFAGRLLAKEGADGVYAMAVAPGLVRGVAGPVGIALKIVDGAERGRNAAAVEVLRALGIAKGARLARLEALAFPPIRNVRGEAVGEVRSVFRLRRGRGRR
jgi:L-asparaginase II